jgi:hypothetical protein
MAAYPTPKAVALSPDGVFYDTGRAHPLSERLDLDDIGAVLNGAALAFRGEEGVVMLDTLMPTTAPGPEWTYTHLRPWTTFTREEDQQVLHVGWWPELGKAHKLGPLLDGCANLAEVAVRLGRYHALTGTPWRYTAGVTGCAALRARYTDPRPGRQPFWHHRPVKGVRGSGPLIWSCPKQPDRDLAGSVFMFDINAMYLAGIRNGRVAWGTLKRHQSGNFDPDWAGYWEIDTARIPAELLDGAERPPIFPRSHIHEGAVWVTTPMAKYVGELIGSLDVLDAYVCENAATVGRTFAERIMAARNGDFGDVGETGLALKRTYAETVGMVAREGGSIWRPDWSHTWMDLSRVNMLRRTDRLGGYHDVWPIAVQTDAAYYFVGDGCDLTPERMAEVLGVGTAPGTFKNALTLTVPEYRAKMRLR